MKTPPETTDASPCAPRHTAGPHPGHDRTAADLAAAPPGPVRDPAADLAAATMADAMAAGAARGPAGARPGWVWALPGGPGCAGHARRVLRDALATLGVLDEAIGDAQLMVSELATNAHQHAGDHGPHELWLYLGDPSGPDARPAGAQVIQAGAEVRCAVFDAYLDASLPGYSWTSGDCGRGLSIVRELSRGRWGMLRTLSRLGPGVRGKAVWFAVPVRGGVQQPVPGF
ncbi:ATP-binding protein [Actinomadura verrucosospora]|uniref:Magnesium or manganese-dependent protein phosphatase n=1 Tax=Actinomadura verrucosospora TaxID=46165 RepID=A0A7D4ANW9_ACTVE|nr:ATP-binding protein [Actinomadura verrucosospora]QKG21509.1 magnesium or manganese-dependent protein phosphatase [Actinomadura verrucosospora]